MQKLRTIPKSQSRSRNHKRYSGSNNGKLPSDFDGAKHIAEKLTEHHIGYMEHPYKNGTMFYIVCPFNSQHVGSCRLFGSLGQLGGRCWHDSCKDKHYKDFMNAIENM